MAASMFARRPLFLLEVVPTASCRKVDFSTDAGDGAAVAVLGGAGGARCAGDRWLPMTEVMLGEITGLNPQGARARVRELGDALLLAAPNNGVRGRCCAVGDATWLGR
jgi:hypothetical protein